VERQEQERLNVEEKNKKYEDFRRQLHSRNQKYNENFEKRIDKIMEYRVDNPMPEMQNFVLNETFYLEQVKFGYKTSTKQALGFPCFRMTSNSSEKERVLANIEKNKLLTTEYTPFKPAQFRIRCKNKDIHPPMRFCTPSQKPRTAGAPGYSEGYITRNRIRPGDVIVKDHPKINKQKTVSFENKPTTDVIAQNLMFSSNRISHTTEYTQPVNVSKIERSPYKTFHHFATNTNSFKLEKENKLFEKKVNEVCYPSMHGKNPTKVYNHHLKANISMVDTRGSLDSDEDFLMEYKMESDRDSLDDIMLEGKNKSSNQRVLEKQNIDRQLFHNNVRSLAAKDALHKSKAYRPNSSFNLDLSRLGLA